METQQTAAPEVALERTETAAAASSAAFNSLPPPQSGLVEGRIMIARALSNLRPSAQWLLKGNSVADLEWLDQTQTAPTEDEINTEVARLQAEDAATEYQRQRAKEYPPITDYLDGVAKGDQAQIDKYIADCAAVKAKYPKPV